MNLFLSDLDNTLIYSQRRELGGAKNNVEWYEGRQISFYDHSCTGAVAGSAKETAGSTLYYPLYSAISADFFYCPIGSRSRLW